MRIQTVTILVALFGTALISDAQTNKGERDEPVLMIAEEDNRTYRVEPGETLADAVAKAALAQSAQEAEKGVCTRDDRVHKPEGAVACKCYEQTECNGTESHTCKRHCRKDLCECCKPST